MVAYRKLTNMQYWDAFPAFLCFCFPAASGWQLKLTNSDILGILSTENWALPLYIDCQFVNLTLKSHSMEQGNQSCMQTFSFEGCSYCYNMNSLCKYQRHKDITLIAVDDSPFMNRIHYLIFHNAYFISTFIHKFLLHPCIPMHCILVAVNCSVVQSRVLKEAAINLNLQPSENEAKYQKGGKEVVHVQTTKSFERSSKKTQLHKMRQNQGVLKPWATQHNYFCIRSFNKLIWG